MAGFLLVAGVHSAMLPDQRASTDREQLAHAKQRAVALKQRVIGLEAKIADLRAQRAALRVKLERAGIEAGRLQSKLTRCERQ